MFTARPDAGGASQIKHIRFAVQKSLHTPPTTKGSACPTSASDHGSYMSRPGGHIVSTARPDARGASQATPRAPNISLFNTTDFETQVTAANNIDNNGQPDGEVTPAISISGGTAFTTTIPDDFNFGSHLYQGTDVPQPSLPIHRASPKRTNPGSL